MQIQWFGTASLSLTAADGTRLLLDPFFRMNDALLQIPLSAYTGYDAILLTHGHVDHILDVPRVLVADKDVPVYCTAAPKRSLVKMGVSPDRVRVIRPGARFAVGPFTVDVRQGRHVRFDLPYIAASAPQCMLRPVKAAKLISSGVTLPERGEIVIYEITCDGKRLTVMGSFGVDKRTAYTPNPDVLVLPYNGSTRIPALAEAPIRALQPKTVFFDHYDNAFPPLTRRMDVEGYEKRLNAAFPEIRTLVPQERRAYEV